MRACLQTDARTAKRLPSLSHHDSPSPQPPPPPPPLLLLLTHPRVHPSSIFLKEAICRTCGVSVQHVRLHACLLVVTVVGTDRTGSLLSGRGRRKPPPTSPEDSSSPLSSWRKLGANRCGSGAHFLLLLLLLDLNCHYQLWYLLFNNFECCSAAS